MKHATALVLAAVLLVMSGCSPRLPSPFTAAQMADVGTGAALVAFLAQPNATAVVCDRRSRGPHVAVFTPDDFDDFTDGLVRGKVACDLWKRCAATMLASWQGPDATPLLDAMGRAYRRLLRDGALERDPLMKAQLEVLHQVFMLRPLGANPRADLMNDWIDELRRGLGKQGLGPVATQYGEDLLATLDLERGIWRGTAVTTATIVAQQDEVLLRRFAARLPDEVMKREARRRIIRKHIAASGWPEVKRRAAAPCWFRSGSAARSSADLDAHASPASDNATKRASRRSRRARSPTPTPRTCAVPVDTREVLENALVHVLGSPVAAGLVQRADDWSGAKVVAEELGRGASGGVLQPARRGSRPRKRWRRPSPPWCLRRCRSRLSSTPSARRALRRRSRRKCLRGSCSGRSASASSRLRRTSTRRTERRWRNGATMPATCSSRLGLGGCVCSTAPASVWKPPLDERTGRRQREAGVRRATIDGSELLEDLY